MSATRVWSKFSVKKTNGDVINLRIVELPKERFEEFLDQYINYFAKEESLFRASGVANSVEAMKELRQVIAIRNSDESFHTVICSLDNSDEVPEIIGASIMSLDSPEKIMEKKTFQGTSPQLKKMIELYGSLLNTYDMLKEFNLERYFVDRGVFVHPNYRGLGIAQELFKVRVWSKFSVKKTNGDVINLRIVELPKERFEEFLDQYINYFAKEESLFRASGVANSVEAMKELRQVIAIRNSDESFHTVICSLDNSDEVPEIIGASIMSLDSPEKIMEKKTFQGTSPQLKKMIELYGSLLNTYDMLKEFNLERYFVDRGVFVHPNYRGLGIAQELFKVRRMICKEHGVGMHGAWMSSYGTQKAAERDGWQTVCEVQFDEHGRKHGVVFQNGPPSCKFMVAKIDLT
uniref:N-acetyltransferase domain-containing protein n=1 Tax=Heliothis virescens TaxID=7102 RepID=A0A2A4J1B8_HELVI